MTKPGKGVMKRTPSTKQIPSLYIEPRRRAMFETMTVYADSLDDEIDDFHEFRGWAVPRLTEYAGQVPRLQHEVEHLR